MGRSTGQGIHSSGSLSAGSLGSTEPLYQGHSFRQAAIAMCLDSCNCLFLASSGLVGLHPPFPLPLYLEALFHLLDTDHAFVDNPSLNSVHLCPCFLFPMGTLTGTDASWVTVLLIPSHTPVFDTLPFGSSVSNKHFFTTH